MSLYSEHVKEHDKMAKNALRSVAQFTGDSYQVVRKRFTDDKDMETTELFWKCFYSIYPDSEFDYVSYCHNCHRFDLSYVP